MLLNDTDGTLAEGPVEGKRFVHGHATQPACHREDA